MRNRKAQLAALAIGLAVSMPLVAQTTAPSSQGGSTASTGTGTATQEDDGFDWGWLGLLGLAGLAGLRRRDDGRMHTTSTTNRP